MTATCVAEYCLCGAVMTATISPAHHALELAARFRLVHTGDGHGSTDSKTAAAARRKAERAQEPPHA